MHEKHAPQAFGHHHHVDATIRAYCIMADGRMAAGMQSKASSIGTFGMCKLPLLAAAAVATRYVFMAC